MSQLFSGKDIVRAKHAKVMSLRYDAIFIRAFV